MAWGTVTYGTRQMQDVNEFLDAQWVALDTQDHSAKPGSQIVTNGIANNAVTQAKIEDKFYAYGQAYRTTSYTPIAVNTWYSLDLNGGDNNLKNVTHSTVTTPERITVTYAGIYEISYSVKFRQTGVAASAPISRIIINGATEIVGSHGEGSTSAQEFVVEITKSNILVSLSANDYITLQIGTNSTGTIVDKYDDVNLPNPTTFIIANVTIEKLSD